MKILHFNQHGTHIGGVEGYIADVSSALSGSGHSVGLVYFSSHDREPLLPNTMYVPLDRKSSARKDNFEDLKRAIDTFKPDVAFIHAVYQSEIVKQVRAFLPSIAYVHGPYLVCPGSAHYLRKSAKVCTKSASLECLIFAQTERCCFGRNPIGHLARLSSVKRLIHIYRGLPILVASHYMRQLLELNGIQGTQISILPPIMFGISPPIFVETLNKILFAGRIVPEKGLHLLIRALATLNGHWELTVAGDGDDLARCKELTHALGLAHRVDFVGWQDGATMSQLYQQCAMVVVPSLWPEPYGRIGPEAFSHGRPVVAFDVGGVGDWLQHGVNGLLVPPGDVDGLRNSISQLLASASLRIEMGGRARKQAERLWSIPGHLEILLPYLQQVMKKSYALGKK